jgi:hypothetical protein
MAQDQAGDFALGFSVSSSTTNPLIAWTGRLATDALSTMGQGEATVHAGGGVETGSIQGQTADRWGDYSAMTIDPADDCTFWYTNEVYPANGIFDWDTYIASFKFPTCAANDFTIGVSPVSGHVLPGGTVQYTVSTALGAGTAESVALYVQNLPSGVTGSFAPTSVTAGGSSTLTLTATASAANATATFMVIGTAPSAVHPATSAVVVGTGTIDAGTDSGDAGSAIDSGGMGGDSGTVADTGAASDSAAQDSGATQDSGAIADSGGTVDSGSQGADSSVSQGDASMGDAETGEAGDAGPGSGNPGSNSGCGCRTVDSREATSRSSAELFLLAGAVMALRRRRRSGRARDASKEQS